MSEKRTIALKEYIRLPMPETLNCDGTTYTRSGRGPRIGVMVALGPNEFGYSIISPKEPLMETEVVEQTIQLKTGSKTVKRRKRVWTAQKIWEQGTFLALERAMGDRPNPEITPKIALPSIRKFERRMKAYFNGNTRKNA